MLQRADSQFLQFRKGPLPKLVTRRSRVQPRAASVLGGKGQSPKGAQEVPLSPGLVDPHPPWGARPPPEVQLLPGGSPGSQPNLQCTCGGWCAGEAPPKSGAPAGDAGGPGETPRVGHLRRGVGEPQEQLDLGFPGSPPEHCTCRGSGGRKVEETPRNDALAGEDLGS